MDKILFVGPAEDGRSDQRIRRYFANASRSMIPFDSSPPQVGLTFSFPASRSFPQVEQKSVHRLNMDLPFAMSPGDLRYWWWGTRRWWYRRRDSTLGRADSCLRSERYSDTVVRSTRILFVAEPCVRKELRRVQCRLSLRQREGARSGSSGTLEIALHDLWAGLSSSARREDQIRRATEHINSLLVSL